ncbi:unnamed protein product, partial [Ectocarpus sp. 12 AP-2014]
PFCIACNASFLRAVAFSCCAMFSLSLLSRRTLSVSAFKAAWCSRRLTELPLLFSILRADAVDSANAPGLERGPDAIWSPFLFVGALPSDADRFCHWVGQFPP